MACVNFVVSFAVAATPLIALTLFGYWVALLWHFVHSLPTTVCHIELCPMVPTVVSCVSE